MDGGTRLSASAAFPSVAIVINPITPAVAAAGEAIPNGCVFETAPETESLTVMLTVPGAAIRELDTEAVKIALVPNVVGSAVPFHWTIENAVNPEPFTKTSKALLPATA
jgi:hypothetical protein